MTKRFSVIEGECDVYDENYHNIVCRTDFKEDAINVCKLLNELHEENTHIKTTIQTRIKNERTAIGQSVLQQLWEQIQ